MHADDRDLIIRALDESLSAEDAQRLTELLRTSADAHAEWEAHHAVRDLVAEHGGASFGPNFTDQVMERLPQPTRRADRPPAKSHRRSAAWKRVGGALAAAVVLVGLSFMLGLWTHTVSVPYGQTGEATLPDGSAVELSAGSTLQYAPFWLPGPRTVTLDGEAFFDVVKSNTPFVVETFNARVVVKGTRFNVRAWRDDPSPKTTVSLASGRVDIMPRASAAESVALRPGETSVVASDTTHTPSASTISLNQATAWRSGGLAFVNQPLASALRELERRFAIDVTLADSSLARMPLTYLNPKPSSAESALADICHVLDLRYRRTADGFTVLHN